MKIGLLSMLLLAGCDISKNSDDAIQEVAPQQESMANQQEASEGLAVFAGCYTANHHEPVQLKVSQKNGNWVMQMKESITAGRVWDDPEPLEVISVEELNKYFSIDADYITAFIGRPDRMMVLAHASPTYVAVDPLLDSEYLAFVYRGANTVYKVECDEVQSTQ